MGCFFNQTASSPARNFVSLGDGGSLTVRFTDNVLVGSGTSALDLWIHEVGVTESSFVDISKDGVTFSSLGRIAGGTQGFDIDALGFGPSDLFPFVRVRDDLAQSGSTSPVAGADIDAIGAITTFEVEPVPVPAAVWLLGPGMFGLIGLARRKQGA